MTEHPLPTVPPDLRHHAHKEQQMTDQAARPHKHDSTEVLKTALARTGQDAQRYAQTGPKKFEDALHQVANQFLDELDARGELR